MRALALVVALSGVASAASVRDLGAVGDGVHDDRAAIQATIDSSTVVEIPAGAYLVSAANGKWCLHLRPGTQLIGAGAASVMLLTASIPDSVQLLYAQDAPGVTISGITLDGQRASQSVSPNQQRHGLFARHADNLIVSGIKSQHFTGDGFYVLESSAVTMTRLVATDNDRNGATLGGGVAGATVTASQFVRNGAEQFDSEGSGHNDDVSIVGCTLDAQGLSQDFVLTVAGVGADEAHRNHRWIVAGSVLNGPVEIVWSDDVEIVGNHGVNPTAAPALYIYRTSTHVSVHNNELHDTGPAGFDRGGGGIVYIVGTNPGQSPADIEIRRNVLTTTQPQYGVVAISAQDVAIERNAISGSGIARTEAGVFARTTRVDVPVSIMVRRNVISDFGAYGVWLAGSGDGAISDAEIADNVFSDAAGTMHTALNLNDGTNAAKSVTVGGNTILGGVTTMMIHPPAGVATIIEATRWVTP